MAGIINYVQAKQPPKAPKAPKSRKAAPTGLGRNLLAGQVNQSAQMPMAAPVAKAKKAPASLPKVVTSPAVKPKRPGGYGGGGGLRARQPRKM